MNERKEVVKSFNSISESDNDPTLVWETLCYIKLRYYRNLFCSAKEAFLCRPDNSWHVESSLQQAV